MAITYPYRAFLACVLISGAFACDDPIDPARETLDANRQLWRSQEIVSYRYEYRLNCFCGGPGSEPVAIEVGDGEVVRVTLTLTSEEVPTSQLSDYPTDVFIDFIENAIDEELGFIASGLVEL